MQKQKLKEKTQEKIKQLLWFTGGALCGLALLSISKASVPLSDLPPTPSSAAPTGVTDDTAIYQSLSEIKVTKERVPSFDSDISQLSRMEGHYHEKLPSASSNKGNKGNKGRPVARAAPRVHYSAPQGE